jgi:NodT family efflux transporter outer membrane factor (OMF) lipoprotein
MAVPAQYAESGDWLPATPADTTDRGPWWAALNDSGLDALEQMLLDGSPTLKIGLSRLDEARATAAAASGAQWPRLAAGIGSTRAQTSTRGPAYSPNRADTYNDLSAAVSLSYEPDLFGRLRAAAASSRALAEASAGDQRSLELALQAELAGDYFTLRILDTTIDALTTTVHDDEKALQLTEALFHGGAIAAGDVAQAEAQLESARSQWINTRLQRAETEHALAVLIGRAPADWHLPPSPLPLPLTIPDIRPGLPSTLLQRRPDVAAAQRRVDSAAAAVGIARSTYFPVFTLGAALGRESMKSDSWFTAPARFWSIAPSAALTLLDGGQRRAQIAGASASLTEATESYRRVVLTAYQEVEDGLAQIRDLGTEQVRADANAAASEIALRQARRRFEGGATTYLEVAVAQNALLAARLASLSVTQRRIQATTELARALGGRWD